MADDQQTTAMEAAGADLKFLMDREGVDPLTQCRFYHSGVQSVRQIGAFAKDADDLKTLT